MKYRILSLEWRYVLVAFICIALLGVGLWSSVASSSQKKELNLEKGKEHPGIEVGNKPLGLTVASVQRGTNYIRVLLRNDYQKTITGYKISTGSGTIYTELLANGERDFLLPGAIRQELHPLNTEAIRILAVIFEDRTADGDSQYIREIQEYRSGMRMQRKHAIHLLKGIMKLQAHEIPAALVKLESQTSFLSEEQDKQLQARVAFGLHDERRRFLRQIQYLQRVHQAAIQNTKASQQNKLELQNELTTLVKQYTSSISKL